jgi:hypothetical protein
VASACPVIADVDDGVYPRVQYVTVIIDGEIAAANQAQIVTGRHGVYRPDSIPSPLDNIDPSQIEEIQVLRPPESLEVGACPGVAAVVVTMNRGAAR